MKMKNWQVIGGLLATVLLSGCNSPSSPHQAPAVAAAPNEAPGAAAQVPGGAAAPDVLAEPVETLPEEDIERDRIKQQARELLASKSYDQLEKLAAEYRRTRAAWPDGHWKLAAFYLGLAEVPKTASDGAWSARVGSLRDWLKQKPKPITAQVALARAFFSGAMRARGVGYADTVTDEMAALMQKRLEQGSAALQASASLRKQCPGWYAAAQRIARLQGWPREEYDPLVDEGIRLFPTYHDLHFARVQHLLPRWHGQEGEWEAYAAKAADRVGGDEGDALYAQIIWSLKSLGIFKNIVRDSKMSWPRAQRGYEVLLRRHPANLGVASAYAALAGSANDLPTARKLFLNPIKNQVVLDIWVTKDWFIRSRARAFGVPQP